MAHPHAVASMRQTLSTNLSAAIWGHYSAAKQRLTDKSEMWRHQKQFFWPCRHSGSVSSSLTCIKQNIFLSFPPGILPTRPPGIPAKHFNYMQWSFNLLPPWWLCIALAPSDKHVEQEQVHEIQRTVSLLPTPQHLKCFHVDPSEFVACCC